VPLPSGAVYARAAGLPGGAPAGATEGGWVFAAPRGMRGRDPHAFYARQLPASGWRCVTDSDAGLPAPAADQGMSFTAYRDGGTALFVAYDAHAGQLATIVDDFHGALPAPC